MRRLASLGCVQDASSGAAICDAQVSAEHGGQTMALSGGGGACSYSGGFYETSGHFVITVTHDGYAPPTREVDVSKGECHVDTARVPVTLTPGWDRRSTDAAGPSASPIRVSGSRSSTRSRAR